MKDEVDARLVRLAKALGGDLLTNDSNLNRVAALQDVNVLNVNDLALALRPNVLPRETLLLTLIREGNQINQGVGYLGDSTMVVVENGKPHIGETMVVMVTQVIQTERGKMIFAHVPEEGELDQAQDARRNAGPQAPPGVRFPTSEGHRRRPRGGARRPLRRGQDLALLGRKPVWRWSYDAYASHPEVDGVVLVARLPI